GAIALRRTAGVAMGAGRAVATVEPDLVRPVAVAPMDEELRIKGDAALGPHVELHHPAVDAIGIELGVDRAVKRVGEINPPAVPADLDHLRSAVERAVPGGRMCRPGDDAPDAHLACQFRLEWIGYVVLVHFPRPPTSDTEEAVIHGQVDVSDKRWRCLESLQQRWQVLRNSRFSGNRDDLACCPSGAIAMPQPDLR